MKVWDDKVFVSHRYVGNELDNGVTTILKENAGINQKWGIKEYHLVSLLLNLRRSVLVSPTPTSSCVQPDKIISTAKDASKSPSILSLFITPKLLIRRSTIWKAFKLKPISTTQQNFVPGFTSIYLMGTTAN